MLGLQVFGLAWARKEGELEETVSQQTAEEISGKLEKIEDHC
jgi:hypothetical protein